MAATDKANRPTIIVRDDKPALARPQRPTRRAASDQAVAAPARRGGAKFSRRRMSSPACAKSQARNATDFGRLAVAFGQTIQYDFASGSAIENGRTRRL